MGASSGAPARISDARAGTRRVPVLGPPWLERVATATVEVQDFALVTHAVPAGRVRPHLPAGAELQTFVDEHGEEVALISSNCFCNRQLHHRSSRYPAVDFHQATFRTYVVRHGFVGSYFFSTYVSTRLSFLTQGALTWPCRRAAFHVDADGGIEGYRRYAATAAAADEVMAFEIEAADPPEAKHPFSSARELIDFITYRLHGFSRSPFGFEVYGPVRHRQLAPYAGSLRSGRFDFWTRRGMLTPEEESAPYSVLVEPAITFTLLPPRPARWSRAGS